MTTKLKDEVHNVNLQISNEQLSKSFNKMWLTDFPDVAATNQTMMSIDDRIVSTFVEKSIKKENARYLLKMPFRTNPQKIPNNRYVAVKRIYST